MIISILKNLINFTKHFPFFILSIYDEIFDKITSIIKLLHQL